MRAISFLIPLGMLRVLVITVVYDALLIQVDITTLLIDPDVYSWASERFIYIYNRRTKSSGLQADAADPSRLPSQSFSLLILIDWFLFRTIVINIDLVQSELLHSELLESVRIVMWRSELFISARFEDVKATEHRRLRNHGFVFASRNKFAFQRHRR